MRKQRNFNLEEKKMIRTLDNMRLYDELMPAIRAVAWANGGADAVLKKSEALAAVTLIEGMNSEKDDVKVKSAIEILNRTVGRPVERSISVYADIAKMNERDLDNQILRTLQQTGAHALIENVVKEIPAPPRKRKPRKSDPLGQASPPGKT